MFYSLGWDMLLCMMLELKSFMTASMLVWLFMLKSKRELSVGGEVIPVRPFVFAKLRLGGVSIDLWGG